MLTAERLRELVEYDPKTGVFVRRVVLSNVVKVGDVAGSKSVKTGHYFIWVEGKRYGAHRLAWLYMTGTWPKKNIDHINGDGSDNRWCNLRDVAQSVNLQNIRSANKRNTSGLLGAHDHGDGKYTSQIQVDGKRRYLGIFSTAAEAHKAYVTAKRVLHVGCTI